MKKSVLGRGLGELIGEIDAAYGSENQIESNSVLELDIDSIIPNPKQPRTVFNDAQIKELSESIKEHGLLQPISVTRDGDHYILIAGERRLRASKKAGFSTIKAIVVNIDDDKLSELALIENIQREDLNPVELAHSYQKLLEEHGLTHDELAKKVAKSRSSISNTLRLLNLSVYVQDSISNNKITLGHAKVMLGLDEKQQKQMVDSIIGQKLSVRDTELSVKAIKNGNAIDPISTKKESFEFDKSELNTLKKIIEELSNNKIQAQLKNNHIKINFSSLDDIETISKYFSK
jgi:ParB family chromosome partitioning protein